MMTVCNRECDRANAMVAAGRGNSPGKLSVSHELISATENPPVTIISHHGLKQYSIQLRKKYLQKLYRNCL